MKGKKPTIVLVDDNPVSLKEGKLILKDHYQVFAVSSGEKLFELLEDMGASASDGENALPDIILLDVMMPGMNGYEVIERLKSQENTRAIPVIFLSALGDAEDELKGLNLGAIDYYQKPFSVPLLLKRIEIHLLMISQTKMLKNMNDELLRAKERAEAANTAKSAFLAHVSHEIRTPLNAIMGMSKLIRIDNLDTVQKDYIKNIQDMSKSLLNIVNDVLDMSKIESGKMDIIPVHFRLRETFVNLCSAYRCLAMDKDLAFRSDLAPELPEVIYGDEVRIRQIATNLLGNAIKYTRQGFVEFRIEKEVRDGSDWLAIVIADSGIGIQEEDYRKLFTLFQQLDQKKNRNIQGTGLGLAITQQFTQLMGGTIEFQSEYCRGTVFTVYLPLVAGEKEKVEEDAVFHQVVAKEPIPVLVVDDNSVNLTVALGFLAANNIKAASASSGIEAFRMIKEKARLGTAYELIFMDHMMPGMDGLETTVRVREWERKNNRTKPMPIVALTANAIIGMDNVFFEAGMDDFVSKPITANQLNRVLKKWLPPEKITLEAVEGAKQSHMDDPLLQELSRIEGLDVSVGLMHVGYSHQGYYLALRQFSQSCDSYLEDLNAALRAGAWEEYSAKAHAIKGVFGVFGTERLSQWAAKLEKMSKANTFGKQNPEFSPETCQEETPLFCAALAEFNALLRKTSLFTTDEVSMESGRNEKRKGDIRFFWEQIKHLKEACLRCSTEEAEKIVARFGEYEWDHEIEERLEKIRRLTSSYDYNAVLEEIEFYR